MDDKKYGRDYDQTQFLWWILAIFALFLVGLFVIELFGDKGDGQAEHSIMTPEVINMLIVMFTNVITGIATFIYARKNTNGNGTDEQPPREPPKFKAYKGE